MHSYMARGRMVNQTIAEDAERMDRPQNGPGYVYLMHAVGTDMYKIGLSANPEKRAYKLDYESPHQIVLVHKLLVDRMRPIEDYFHQLFRDNRVKNEWFRLDEFEVNMFCSLYGHNEAELIIQVCIDHKYHEYRKERYLKNKLSK